MAKRLTVIDGADQGRFFPLFEGVVTIGNNHRHADICLHDLYVRRVHCLLDVKGDRVVARANDKTAPITVNGQPATEQELRLGDVLRVGNSHLRLEDARAAAAAEDEDVEVLEVADEEDEEGEETVEVLEAEEVEVVEDEPPAKKEKFTPAPALPAGRLAELTDHLIAQYEIGSVLGRGQCGVVFRARDRKAGHVVALKVLFPGFPLNAGEMQQFASAMRTLLPLRHPNLVTLYNAGRTAPYTWLALEYVEGESLAQTLERMGGSPGKLGWKHALRLGVHAGRGLEFIHRHRLLHGNVTPQNILIRLSDKLAKLGDLMLARSIEGSSLQASTLEKKLLAELPYMAPEQVDPDAFVDSLSDIYGLGAVIYARITGRPPFRGETPEETIAQIQEAPLVRPRQLQPAVPEALDVAVAKMLMRHQEERYPTTAELLADLERIAEEEGVTL
jgi:pSer/pThr/pTyr-binding forkhead associated (FHA) protein